MMKNKMIISLIAGVAVSIVALYFAFRNVPIGDLYRYLASINYLWGFPALAMVMISFYLRAVRCPNPHDTHKRSSSIRKSSGFNYSIL